MAETKPRKPRKSRATAPAPGAEPVKAKRPTVDEFTADIAETICVGLMDGMSLRRICEPETMPHRTTVFRWLADPVKYGVAASFSDQYANAREAQAHAFADDIIDVADDSTNDFMERKRGDGSTVLAFDGENVQRSKLRFEARKWAASKILPKVYGDKQVVEHAGKIQTESLDDPMQARAEVARFIEAQRQLEKAGNSIQ